MAHFKMNPHIILIILMIPMFMTACSGSKKSSKYETVSFTQIQVNAENEGDEAVQIKDRMPAPIGGLEAIYRDLKYPVDCRRARASGRVVVQFTVYPDGTSGKFSIIQGIHRSCDREAIRAIRQVKWEQGIMDGKPVAVQFQLPIVFRLN